ncbi:MAG: tryptophan synthase subunit alpha [Eubacteriales bacterium]
MENTHFDHTNQGSLAGQPGQQSRPNRIDTAFAALRKNGKKAFIPFITAGDPSIGASYEIARAMIENGADLVEFGVPYSDPSADGPVIMRADVRALAHGTRLADVFSLAGRITEEFPAIPVVLLLYFNSVFVYGLERFFDACEKAGISGVIIPDLPLEERDEARPFADPHGVYLISMVTPVSKERTQRILAQAQGFLYCVASLGVTGERASYSTDFKDYFDTLNQFSDIPKCIGFGVSTPEQKNELEAYCDGVIVGSAIVRRIEDCIGEGLTDREIAARLGEYVRSFTEVPQ